MVDWQGHSLIRPVSSSVTPSLRYWVSADESLRLYARARMDVSSLRGLILASIWCDRGSALRFADVGLPEPRLQLW
jgi:hypothetical protein